MRRAKTTPAALAALAALSGLFDDTVALFHRLTAVAEEVHGQGGLSAARRGVLRSLDRLGPQTVPQMARARPVSRQLIQTLVNDLRHEGYVELTANPAHRRSSLVRLTRRGKTLVDAIGRRELRLLKKLAIPVSERELAGASSVLRTVREALESVRWKGLVAENS